MTKVREHASRVSSKWHSLELNNHAAAPAHLIHILLRNTIGEGLDEFKLNARVAACCD
jgi:hypothetical protein